ncbi:choice-of-anchor I family protein [Aquimarina muelleri]|uniref:Choice-of-anchor I domain-containing protein n=1 Tax=Aquimarina muelleri TaxID=279356 RepID=A0A918N4A4_9FLAO|nr:choice-of-anchor I family protein [Aquimarina muelleri]MCX2762485.1 choice-of-anchor I family protein [Aquimarina muelleri]GGX20515.1 hypothetical protein GCM10007384_22320 [Aquimarina muelleri]
MRTFLLRNIAIPTFVTFFISCSGDIYQTNDDNDDDDISSNASINFKYASTINVGGLTAAEITTFDPETNRLFIVNNDQNSGTREISVYDISDIKNPTKEASIDLISLGGANSVSAKKGKLAIAVEAIVKQNQGKILVYDTKTMTLENTFDVGSLPDMVTFTPDGNIIVVANEGEPNIDYTNDPEGSISVIDLKHNSVNTLDFHNYDAQEATLEAQGYRVSGLNANLSQDTEPEYVAVSDDSKTAWVSLQENNGIAKVNLITKQIEAIYPLGYKDYSLSENKIDASDKDNEKVLKNWDIPLYGLYMPDGIEYISIKGQGYVITANEGDSREYTGNPGFVDETRVKDIVLEPTVFSTDKDYQNNSNLGRLKIISTMGDIDNDGDYDKLYSFGGRSFSIWTTNGNIVYDSGSSIAAKTLELTPDLFNSNDSRSDDKGSEPETVEVLKLGDDDDDDDDDQAHVLFVGLERNHQVMVYNIDNPTNPVFVQILSHSGDEAPEGLLAIQESDSPTGNALMVVSNEGSGTVSIYENEE